MVNLIGFLRPLYQDLDGVSRFDAALRIGAIAKRLTPPTRELELLILFHPLGNWLDKVGNLSRVTLTVGDVTESELRRTAASIKRLDAPVTGAERAVAAAILLDSAGARGFAERLSRARREGSSIAEVCQEALRDEPPPEWLDARATAWLQTRRAARTRMAETVLAETELTDLITP
jgi:hypothetical protein